MSVDISPGVWAGWNSWRIANGEVELIVPADIGPRIMRYAFIGEHNAFLEIPPDLGASGEPDFRARGGHRLWTAPERFPRTYAPDNAPVEVNIQGALFQATGPVEGNTGLRKQLIIRMAPLGSAVTVVHRLINALPWTIELAPWTITMMAPGGKGFTGFPPRGHHPECLNPTHPLVMWAFTNFADPRWTFLERYLLLRQDPAQPLPQKAGLWNLNTWGGYWRDGLLFLKRYHAEPGKTYPDFGCSFEIWTNSSTLELETLGPLTRLEPGAFLEHTERWTLHRSPEPDWSDSGLDALTAALL